jgi:hypothetical protein
LIGATDNEEDVNRSKGLSDDTYPRWPQMSKDDRAMRLPIRTAARAIVSAYIV